MVLGKVCQRFFTKVILYAGLSQVKKVLGTINLYAFLESGIEGAIHTVREWADIGRGIWEITGGDD